MIVVYEFESGEVMITDGTVDEKTFHMKMEYGKKTIYDNGVIIITPDLKIEEG
jgi:hypothetical protein